MHLKYETTVTQWYHYSKHFIRNLVYAHKSI